jgi:hypothetical protein
MKSIKRLFLVAWLAFGSSTVLAEQAGELARKFCNKHSCQIENVVDDIIRNPVLGTCLVISTASVSRKFSVNSSDTNWWLLIPESLSTKEFNQAISIAKNFSSSTHKQTFLAEPLKGEVRKEKMAYCTASFDLTNGGHPIGLLIPKF